MPLNGKSLMDAP